MRERRERIYRRDINKRERKGRRDKNNKETEQKTLERERECDFVCVRDRQTDIQNQTKRQRERAP